MLCKESVEATTGRYNRLKSPIPIVVYFFFLIDTAPTEIYPLPLHDALPILRGEPRREHRLAHADVALRAVVGLETGEQRAMPEMFGALAVAMDAVEHLWGLARSRVCFGGPGSIQHRARGKDSLSRHSRAGLGVHDPPASARRHEQPHSRRPRYPRDDPGELGGHSASRVANTSPP